MKVLKKGYKDTEVGVIPTDWQIRNIANSCSIKARIGWQGLTKSEYQKFGEFILITGTDFKNGAISWETCSFVSKYRYEQDRYIQVQIGDVLITKDGTIGKVASVNELPYPSTLNSGVFVVRPLDKDIDKIFLSLIFKSKYFDDFLDKLIAGSTINHLYQKDFVSFNFPIPSKQEQQAIAEALSDIDALINALNKQIEKKKNIKQGAMQELLTGKKRLQGFTEKWSLLEIGSLLKVKHGKDQKTVQTLTGIYPILGTGGILGYSNKSIYEKESILIGRKGTIDKPQYINKPFWSVDTLFYTEINEGISVKFLYYLMRTIDWYSYNEASGVPSLNAKTIEKIEILFPPTKEEQIAIAKILTDMDNEIEQLEKKRDKYLNIKSGMMQQLLTGQIRLITPVLSSKDIDIKLPVQKQQKHNDKFEDAIIISFLVKKFGSVQYPLSRFRYNKLMYLFLRKHVQIAEGYNKHAAGPYKSDNKYRGGEGIAIRNKYISKVSNPKSGKDAFVVAEDIDKAFEYFDKYFDESIVEWIEQFRYYKNDYLGVLATVDESICDLCKKNQLINIHSVKNYIKSTPEWNHKLQESAFSDVHIQRAINESIRLFKI